MRRWLPTILDWVADGHGIRSEVMWWPRFAMSATPGNRTQLTHQEVDPAVTATW
jgi:hypothetical protein